MMIRELTDTERLEIAVNLLTERQVDEYAAECNKAESQEIISKGLIEPNTD